MADVELMKLLSFEDWVALSGEMKYRKVPEASRVKFQAASYDKPLAESPGGVPNDHQVI